MSNANIRDIVMFKNVADYGGIKPVVEIKQPLDVALDISTGKSWQYDGNDWVPYIVSKNNGSYHLRIGDGVTVKECIENTYTQSSLELYAGDDELVHVSLRYSDKDLVIRHNANDPMVIVRIGLIDDTAEVVTNYTDSIDYVNTMDGNWLCIRNYVDLIKAGKALIILCYSSSTIFPSHQL